MLDPHILQISLFIWNHSLIQIAYNIKIRGLKDKHGKKNFQAFPLIGVINLCTIIESSWTKPVEEKYQSFHLWWIAKLLILQANFESVYKYKHRLTYKIT